MQLYQRNTGSFELGACALRDARVLTREASDRFAPDNLIKADREAAGRRHRGSAFAVSGLHLVRQRGEVFGGCWHRAEPCVDAFHRRRASDLHQLRRETLQPLCDALDLCGIQRRHASESPRRAVELRFDQRE